ncbi:hypothetical protein R4Z09_20760 [Niallia oryzisoli]|uniref:Uncharacterized protein n=1 Tax=Niallia oryzisoli TaxID=1737571 RepID=A0ABZ2CBP4_9BACI
MKRYWKSILLCSLSIIVVGTFYIQSSFADQTNIQIKFDRVKGDENEVKDLILYGDYSVGNLYQSLKITSEETIDQNQQSFLQRMTTGRFAPVFKDLMKEHKGFLRGKELSPANYYENENLLVYAGLKGDSNEYPMRNIKFDIQIFNKKSGKKMVFQSDIPEKEKYSFMNVEDVQVINGELKVMVRGFGIHGGEDLRYYTFNIDEQKLVKDETIVSTQTTEKRWTDIRIIHDYNSIQPQNHYLILTETYEAQRVQENGEMTSYDGEPKLVENEAFVYRIDKNQLKKLEIPDELPQSGESYSIVDSTIFIHNRSANGIEVNQYDMEKEEWENPLTFELPLSANKKDQPYIKFMNGKMYLIRSTSNGHTLFIGDVKTGESLYEGNLNVKNQRDVQKEYQLYFHEVNSL